MMRIVTQTLDQILNTLQKLDVDWKDDVAVRVIGKLAGLPRKKSYSATDIATLLDPTSKDTFEEGLLVCRLFLGLSDDTFDQELKDALGDGGSGVLRYRKDRDAFLAILEGMDLPEAMTEAVNRQPHWSDTLVERLRSGRGSAVSGQKRGRRVEDFAEQVVRKIFASNFEARCTFTGTRGRTAKCDFAIPSRNNPRIVIESKGYAATGSKMSDVIGDIKAIIAARRTDTVFLFVTDGLTWKRRQSDLQRIIEHQNQGDIQRIYTLSDAAEFESDLATLKLEAGL
jgi:DpnII restriction endonuclease